MTEHSRLIQIISKANPSGEYLIKFMDTYGLDNLRDATEDQLQEFIDNNHDDLDKDNRYFESIRKNYF